MDDYTLQLYYQACLPCLKRIARGEGEHGKGNETSLYWLNIYSA